jgi:hypothetical protein
MDAILVPSSVNNCCRRSPEEGSASVGPGRTSSSSTVAAKTTAAAASVLSRYVIARVKDTRVNNDTNQGRQRFPQQRCSDVALAWESQERRNRYSMHKWL